MNGAIVAMDPHTGRVLALSGGFSYASSQFDRAMQAMRQPGSSFKPFVYAAALDNGFTPVSKIDDTPVSLLSGPGPAACGRRKTSTGKFFGPITLRRGIELSRNVMTVRLASEIGMDKITPYPDALRRLRQAAALSFERAGRVGNDADADDDGLFRIRQRRQEDHRRR